MDNGPLRTTGNARRRGGQSRTSFLSAAVACSGQRQLELVALQVDDLRDGHVDVAAIEQELRVDERDPDDATVVV